MESKKLNKEQLLEVKKYMDNQKKEEYCIHCERRKKEKGDYCLKCYNALSNPIKQVYNNNPVGRNDTCPCGSGKKYKKCCLNNRS